VKFIIRINHADNPSILNGIAPKNNPPLRRNSIPPGLKPFQAKILEIKAMTKTKITVITGLILLGTKGIAIIPEKKRIANDLKRKAINSLSS
jgi:hypothetical protein